MSPFVQLATKDGAKLVRKQRPDRCPDDSLENYLSPAQEIEVLCSTDEREDFEAHTEIRLDADVVEMPAEFQKLIAFLTADYALKVIRP